MICRPEPGGCVTSLVRLFGDDVTIAQPSHSSTNPPHDEQRSLVAVSSLVTFMALCFSTRNSILDLSIVPESAFRFPGLYAYELVGRLVAQTIQAAGLQNRSAIALSGELKIGLSQNRKFMAPSAPTIGGELLVPRAGLEPAHACARRILSPLRLPFRHLGTRRSRRLKPGYLKQR